MVRLLLQSQLPTAKPLEGFNFCVLMAGCSAKGFYSFWWVPHTYSLLCKLNPPSRIPFTIFDGGPKCVALVIQIMLNWSQVWSCSSRCTRYCLFVIVTVQREFGFNGSCQFMYWSPSCLVSPCLLGILLSTLWFCFVRLRTRNNTTIADCSFQRLWWSIW